LSVVRAMAGAAKAKPIIDSPATSIAERFLDIALLSTPMIEM